MHLIYGTALLASLGFVPMLNAGSPIGTVVTPGRMIVNNLVVDGNTTLFEGAVLKTPTSPARIDLNAGGAVSLDKASEAVALDGRIQLRSGKGVATNPEIRIEALGLNVKTADSQSQVAVAIHGDTVQVAALRGAAKVRNHHGTLLALVHMGKPLSFQPDAGRSKSTGSAKSTESSVTGTLRREGSLLLLRDELTDTDVELRGSGLATQQGRRIQVSGQTLATGDSGNHIILVSRLNRLEPETAPTSTANSTSSTTPTTGMSAGTKIGLATIAIGGVAAVIAVPLAMSN